MTDNETLTLEHFGPNGWLDFIPAGRGLIDPLRFHDAVIWAVYGEHGEGSTRFRWNDAGEVVCDKPLEELKSNWQAWTAGYAAIVKSLAAGKLSAFALNPQGVLLQVDRMYWWRDKTDSQSKFQPGFGVPNELVGALALVDREQLPAWRLIAVAATEAVTPLDEQPVVTSTAAAVRECAKWLREQFSNGESKGWAKPRFRELALSKFAGRLSGRGFDKSWEEVIADHPDRAKAGAKPKS